VSKPKRDRALADNRAQAVLRRLRTSPRKLNLVAASIRGLPVSTALAQLSFSRRRIAKDVRKTLQAAIANAENNHALDVDRLVVSEAHVGKSMVMRRFHARGRGRAASVEKFFSHLTIVVDETRAEAKPAAAPAGEKK